MAKSRENEPFGLPNKVKRTAMQLNSAICAENLDFQSAIFDARGYKAIGMGQSFHQNGWEERALKILTLNVHSLHQADCEQKFKCFLESILYEQPDLIALQEVNQTAAAPMLQASMLCGNVEVPDVEIPLRSDNYAAWLAFALRQAGFACSWSWLPVKRGYDRYDEGLALLALKNEIEAVDVRRISRRAEYEDWRTRKALGVKLRGKEDWFYTVHMGWWNDDEEPFLRQWNALKNEMRERRNRHPIWLMGDFNSPAEVRGEGYDCICADGWQDAWRLAGKTGGGVTMEGEADGWRDGSAQQGVRIDHIWCSRPFDVHRIRVAFDGREEPKVSDHYGVLLETGSITA